MVGQVDQGAVELLHRSFGGSRFVARSRRERARPLHCWRATHTRASVFLAATLPYLRIKRRQAELCLELRRLTGERSSAVPLASATAELHDEIRRLNRVEGRAARQSSSPSPTAGGSSAQSRGSGRTAEAAAATYPADVLAYAAGVIDSDGSIRIRRDTYAMRVLKNTLQATFSECVTIRQLETDAIDLLHAYFGGSRRLIVTRSEVRIRQPLHSLELVDKRAATLLRSILPFLRLKGPQAELCLELRRLKDASRMARFAHGRGHRGGSPRPAAISSQMERVREQVLALNGRHERFTEGSSPVSPSSLLSS